MKWEVVFFSCIFLVIMVPLCSQTLGDVNNDSMITIIDALLTAQYYVDLDPAHFSLSHADVNCSGNINIIDALLMAQYYVGLTGEFNCEATPPPTPLPETDLFCTFQWGLNNNGGQDIPAYIDLLSVWVGYEKDDGMNNAVSSMLSNIISRAPDIIPVYYAYFIAFKASVHGGLGDCNTDFDGHNLCNEGARWIRDNRDYILAIYDSYARMTVEIWGTEQPFIWLIEPDFIQYTYEEQTDPLTMPELAQLANDIINTIKNQMPNAIISLFHATWTYGVAEYWSYFDLSQVDLINTTGMADQDGYFNDGDAAGRAEATYAFLHQVTGKPIFVDTSFGVTEQGNTWSNAPADVLNARISEGVCAVLIEPAPVDYEDQIGVLNPRLISPCDQKVKIQLSLKTALHNGNL
jgi:hypothetical protein